MEDTSGTASSGKEKLMLTNGFTIVVFAITALEFVLYSEVFVTRIVVEFVPLNPPELAFTHRE